ncbi:mitochondrial mRNA processing protein [Sporothrix schenckii 1099-18]|uniref:Mitochondrial mRNA processing protein n=1 Tax=Sporothrix schenckii 1099-18 TaxID=1397361 RepID=A0A0F2LXI2_SPOSC|nr:mitochondrial mRNA processing protein [Sporothrix schenckii 1099-18]KJR81205.1 mitochondrial mRNA processing protein [Sporothrix schenckii 1099-18]
MHQLARGTRLGLVQQPHVCTTCFVAFGRLVPTARGTLRNKPQQPSHRYIQHAADPTAAGTTAGTNPETPSADPGTNTKVAPPPARKSAKPATHGSNGASTGSTSGGRKVMKPAKAAAKAAHQAKAGLNGATSHQGSQTQLKLWRETLDVLKKLESAQGRLAEQAAIATGVATKELANTASSAKGDASSALATTGKVSKKKKTSSAHTPEEREAAVKAAKDTQDQIRMLTSALHLLKTVLSTQGPQQQEEKEQEQSQQTTAATKGDQSGGKLGKHARKKAQKMKTGQDNSPLGTQHVTAAGAAVIEPEISPGAVSTTSSTASQHLLSKKASSPKKKAVAASSRSFLEPPPVHRLPYRVSSVDSRDLALTPVEENKRPVPKLHYGLDRALFNPGVYHLQDPRSRVFNFDPYLASIMPLQEFDFNALKQYVTSSKDPTLISMAAKYNMKYSGSTSSMTSMLSHFHFLLSGWRPINTAHTTRSFTPESMSFTRITRGPAATFLHWKDGTYAIDADKEFDTANILSMLGKSMEKLLTLSKEDFEKYRVTRSHELTEEERNDPESFHYSTFGDFMMRSQLDAYDPRLPGTGMFDLKTRAVVSIRMDAQDFQRGLGYEIRQRFGQWESFEREYFDMIRSAFLKYSLQVRMGRMDGIYVAFHNTQRIFGFQYISINEMDVALHGTDDTTLGDREFKLSLHLLNAVLDKATDRFPGRSLRLHIETRPSEAAPFMYIFATPVTSKEIGEVQDAGKESVEEFERRILGITAQESGENDEGGSLTESATDDGEMETETAAKEHEVDEEPDHDEDAYSVDVWETMRQKVEETMENEAQGIESVRDTLEDALEQSGLLRGRPPEETRTYVDALLEAITRTDTEAVAETILKGQEPETGLESTLEVETPEEEQIDAETEAEVEGAPDHETVPKTNRSSAEAEITEPETSSESDFTEVGNTTSATTDKASTLSYDWSKSVIDEGGGRKCETSGSGVDEAPPASPVSGTLSLKDLIIKLAAKVETSQARDSVGSIDYNSNRMNGETQQVTKDGDDDSITTKESPLSFRYSNSVAELVDAPKNKRFERILSEMLASSKESKEGSEGKEGKDGKEGNEGKEGKEDREGKNENEGKERNGGKVSSKGNAPAPEPPEIIGMIMTIRNKVNGRYVVRPDKLTNADSWKVEYAIEEIQTKRARTLYNMLKARRKALLSKDRNGKDSKDGEDKTDGEVPKADGIGDMKKTSTKSAFNRDFMSKLYALSAKGRRFRSNENRIMRKRPVHIYGVDGSRKWGEVFANEMDDVGTLQRDPVEGGKKRKPHNYPVCIRRGLSPDTFYIVHSL